MTRELSRRRREILALLGDIEWSGARMAAVLDREQTNVVRDLSFLREAGLVERRYVGVRALYRAVKGAQ